MYNRINEYMMSIVNLPLLFKNRPSIRHCLAKQFTAPKSIPTGYKLYLTKKSLSEDGHKSCLLILTAWYLSTLKTNKINVLSLIESKSRKHFIENR